MPTWLGGDAPARVGAAGEAAGLPTGENPTPGTATAGSIAGRLMHDYNLTREQAIGAVGVMGYESGNFQVMQERPSAYNGWGANPGGWGWAQWTGPRRRAFMAWAEARGLDPSSDAANYGFLQHELATNYSHVIPRLQREQTVAGAARAWEEAFEGMQEGGPGVPAFAAHIARAEHYNRILPQDLGQAQAPNAFEQAWIPHWEGVDRHNPWGNLQNYWGNSTPLGVSAGDTNTTTATQNVVVHVDGASDPHIVSNMVASNIKRGWGDITRNMIGATN